MPELPEVEVLVRHLVPLLKGKMVRGVVVHRAKSVRPASARTLRNRLVGARFKSVTRRAKYLLFEMQPQSQKPPFILLGHLGMTGRMYIQPSDNPLPRHAAVTMELGSGMFVFEDTRYFGRLTLDNGPLETLGPEPLEDGFDGETLRASLRRTSQAIKVKLLDQSIVAGVGNIYASETLHQAGISPRKMARRLSQSQCDALVESIRKILRQAIECGSTIPLDFAGTSSQDGLFYYGKAVDSTGYYEEKLAVYDREDDPCFNCSTPIRRIVQAARSTYYCPLCQRG